MDLLPLYPDTPGDAAAWFTATYRTRLARTAQRQTQRLKFAAQMIVAGSQFIPLCDNGKLLARLSARVRATRDCGA